MQSNATDFIERFTVRQLEAELKELRRRANEKQKVRDRAAEEYAEVANKVLVCEQLLNLKQTSEKRASVQGDTISFLGNGQDQTAAVLALIQGAGKMGIRPKEIAKALEIRGLVVKAAYLHTILMRLKKRHEVRSVRGSYSAGE